MTQYEILLNILDRLRAEAPPGFSSYHPAADETELLNVARSKAFIHLLLKVYFGITAFQEREAYVTEGTSDGGIDAYYIDGAKKIIYSVEVQNDREELRGKGIGTKLLMMDVTRTFSMENGHRRTVSRTIPKSQ